MQYQMTFNKCVEIQSYANFDQYVLSWCDVSRMPFNIRSSGFVTMHVEKITHFEHIFQTALYLGPAQRTLKKKFEVH